jgi:hypothetical protein
MQSKLVSQFLSPLECTEIRGLIESEAWGGDDWGRKSCDLPNNLKIEEEMKRQYGEDLVFTYAKWVRYSTLYGSPKVPPHVDMRPCTYTFDIQLRSTVNWPLVVNGVEYLMGNGDAVLYGGEDQLHWRPPYPTKDPMKFVEVAFYHYVKPNHWSLTGSMTAAASNTLAKQKTKKLLDKYEKKIKGA